MVTVKSRSSEINGFQMFLKTIECDVAAEVTVGGRVFQTRAAAVPKARSLTVKSLVLGTISCWLDDERRRCRESVSAAHWRSLTSTLEPCHVTNVNETLLRISINKIDYWQQLRRRSPSCYTTSYTDHPTRKPEVSRPEVRCGGVEIDESI